MKKAMESAFRFGAKGVIEVELVSSGAKWGRGPKKDVHSANRARLDSPAFRLVQALATLVTPEGDPAIEGFATAARPPSARERALPYEFRNRRHAMIRRERDDCVLQADEFVDAIQKLPDVAAQLLGGRNLTRGDAFRIARAPAV